MKALLKVVLPLFVFCSCSEEEITFNFEVSKVKDAINIEKSLGSIEYEEDFPGPNSAFYPYSDSLKPPNKGKFFRRKSDAFIPLITKYFYDSQTQEVKMTVYEWSKAIPGTTQEQYNELVKNEVKKQATYDQLYQKIYNQLFETYGKHNIGNGRLIKSGLEVFPTWKRSLGWHSDSLNIDLIMNWIPTDQINVYNIICKVYP